METTNHTFGDLLLVVSIHSIDSTSSCHDVTESWPSLISRLTRRNRTSEQNNIRTSNTNQHIIIITKNTGDCRILKNLEKYSFAPAVETILID
jgi:hypothetical protein